TQRILPVELLRTDADHPAADLVYPASVDAAEFGIVRPSDPFLVYLIVIGLDLLYLVAHMQMLWAAPRRFQHASAPLQHSRAACTQESPVSRASRRREERTCADDTTGTNHVGRDHGGRRAWRPDADYSPASGAYHSPGSRLPARRDLILRRRCLHL